MLAYLQSHLVTLQDVANISSFDLYYGCFSVRLVLKSFVVYVIDDPEVIALV